MENEPQVVPETLKPETLPEQELASTADTTALKERLASASAEQATEDHEDLTEVRETLEELPASKESLHNQQDLEEAAASFQESIRAKGETVQYTPEQLQDLARFIYTRDLTKGTRVLSKRDLDSYALNIGAEAEANMAEHRAKRARQEVLLKKVLPIVERIVPPVTAVGSFAGILALQPNIVGGIGLGLLGLGGVVHFFTTVIAEEDYPMLSTLLIKKNGFAKGYYDRHDDQNSKLVELPFLKNSAELTTIIDKLQGTNGFATLKELTARFKALEESSADLATVESAKAKYKTERRETIHASLKELGLEFNAATMEMIASEATNIRSQKEHEKNLQREKAAAEAEVKKSEDAAIQSQFNEALQAADKTQGEIVAEREAAEQELAKH